METADKCFFRMMEKNMATEMEMKTMQEKMNEMHKKMSDMGMKK